LLKIIYKDIPLSQKVVDIKNFTQPFLKLQKQFLLIKDTLSVKLNFDIIEM